MARHTGAKRNDEGSALIMTLMLVLVGSMIVGGLAAFADGLLRARPPLDARGNGAEAVRSGTRMAITLQREYGPRGCFTASPVSWTLNGDNVSTSCTTIGTPYVTGKGRYGVLTTSNRNSDTNVAGNGGAVKKDIDGAVFVNAGRVNGTNADILVKDAEVTYSSYTSASQPVNRYRDAANVQQNCNAPQLSLADSLPVGMAAAGTGPHTHTHNCTTDAWWQRAGDNLGAGWAYPKLPPIPTYERPGSQASIGSCTLYYPGRYVTGGTMTLNGGTHYFASGVYYFERPLVIQGGANVVFGEGKNSGCATDADAAFATTSPKNHEITGKGATLVFGLAANLTVNNSSVRINRRVSTAANRGSEGIAIRTVSFGVTSADVEIPADTVLLADGTTVAASTHSVKPSASSPAVSYKASTLTPTAFAIDATLNGGSGATNRLLSDGYIFTPHAKVRVTSTVTSYQLRLISGVVASSLQLNMTQMAATPATNYAVGMLSDFIQRKVRLQSTTTVNGRLIASTAILEVHVDKSYAINSWVVDA